MKSFHLWWYVETRQQESNTLVADIWEILINRSTHQSFFHQKCAPYSVISLLWKHHSGWSWKYFECYHLSQSQEDLQTSRAVQFADQSQPARPFGLTFINLGGRIWFIIRLNLVWNIYSATTFNFQEGKWQAKTLHYVAPMCHLLTGDTQHLSGFDTLKYRA